MNATQTQADVAQPWEHTAEANGVRIERGEGLSVTAADTIEGPLGVEVTYRGNTYRKAWFDPRVQWYARLGDVDLGDCIVRVLDKGGECLAALGAARKAPCENYQPFMELQGEQVHVTESYVSVPPALTIVDEVGAVWTLGFGTAPQWQSPRGEFAFNVLRNGVDTGEVASRIERRGGRVKIFTRHGWKTWSGTTFI